MCKLEKEGSMGLRPIRMINQALVGNGSGKLGMVRKGFRSEFLSLDMVSVGMDGISWILTCTILVFGA